MISDTLTLMREITLNALMKYSVDWESKPFEEFNVSSDWTRLNGGYVRCLTSNNLFSTLEIIMPPNTTFDYHTHPDGDEEFYVIEGHVELTILNKTVNVREGEVFKIKAGILHKAFYPYGMRGIITIRKTSVKSESSKKIQAIETLLKLKGETDASPDSSVDG